MYEKSIWKAKHGLSHQLCINSYRGKKKKIYIYIYTYIHTHTHLKLKDPFIGNTGSPILIAQSHLSTHNNPLLKIPLKHLNLEK